MISTVSLYNATFSSKLYVVLQAATVHVVGADGKIHKAKLMFGSGSVRTYVSRKLVHK